MSIEKIRPSWTFNEEKIEELKRIVPECITDGVINWEVLKESLGEYLEEDNQNIEHFGLFWPGKREARKMASQPSKGTLVPVAGEGVDEDNTKNIFIEGENLEVLKLLQKSYAGKVKMIYIDPPYNTGNDFVYEDDFKESIDEYLRRTGQTNEHGKPLTTNKKADGRFHSKWLSMMYPRLRLARNLLSEDGVIFVSIDDNEIHNLRQIMNEIYGEENYIDVLKWKRKKQPSFLATHTAKLMEYIVIFSREKNNLEKLSIEGTSDFTKKVLNVSNKYSTRVFKRGVRVKLDGKGIIKKGKYLIKTMDIEYLDDVYFENGKTTNEVQVIAKFQCTQELIDIFIESNLLFITKQFGLRRDVSEEEIGKRKSITDLLIDGWGDNQDSEKELIDIFGTPDYFEYTKPTQLIRNLIKSCFSNDSIILDFFAGSGTTAHSIMDLNKEDTGNRKYILVQMQELCDVDTKAFKAGYNNIADICKDRIRLAGKRIKEEFESKPKDNSLDFEDNEKNEIDFGFKVFKLAKSNYKEWQDYTGNEISQLESLFENAIDPLVPDWKEEDVLTETLLIEGFPLDSKIEILDDYKLNKILLVSSDFHEHRLIICLDKEIKQETIQNIHIVEPDIFICLDSAITDEFKVRLQDKGRIKTI